MERVERRRREREILVHNFSYLPKALKAIYIIHFKAKAHYYHNK